MDDNLKIRLEHHSIWLLDSSKGKRFSIQKGTNLQDVNLQNANLRNADLQGVDLRNANLRNADLQYADLRGANLQYADLRFANLHSANLINAYLQHANLNSVKGLNFTPLQIINAKYFITIFDDYVLWGCKKMTFDEVKAFKFKDCEDKWDKDEFKLNKKIITEMIRYYGKQLI